jgi:hypothetical protein
MDSLFHILRYATPGYASDPMMFRRSANNKSTDCSEPKLASFCVRRVHECFAGGCQRRKKKKEERKKIQASREP